MTFGWFEAQIKTVCLSVECHICEEQLTLCPRLVADKDKKLPLYFILVLVGIFYEQHATEMHHIMYYYILIIYTPVSQNTMITPT